MSELNKKLGIVVIGRNEGERLHYTLRSVVGKGAPVVYVDSGSKDGSPQYAASAGCSVVELDPSLPFSAARGRNEGYAHLMEIAPEVSFVQFLDGDCEVMEGWLEKGVDALTQLGEAGIVCGHVAERYPRASIYNLLCAQEWQQKPGEIRAAGGRFMVRAEIFRDVGGFRPEIIAGEDDEFSLRVRLAGWKIIQVDAPMGVHDAAMTRFGQWWQRAKRAGHAYGQGMALHGKTTAERYYVQDCRRIWLWGLAVPLTSLVLAPFTRGFSLLLLLAYPLAYVRLYGIGRKRQWSRKDSLIYAFFTSLFKFTALFGLIEYYSRRRSGKVLTIIEYNQSSRRA